MKRSFSNRLNIPKSASVDERIALLQEYVQFMANDLTYLVDNTEDIVLKRKSMLVRTGVESDISDERRRVIGVIPLSTQNSATTITSYVTTPSNKGTMRITLEMSSKSENVEFLIICGDLKK